jgi:hypothetical protein
MRPRPKAFAVLCVALVIFAAFAFVAAFLNSVFAFCLGCQIYLLLVRARLLGRGAASDRKGSAPA